MLELPFSILPTKSVSEASSQNNNKNNGHCQVPFPYISFLCLYQRFLPAAPKSQRSHLLIMHPLFFSLKGENSKIFRRRKPYSCASSPRKLWLFKWQEKSYHFHVKSRFFTQRFRTLYFQPITLILLYFHLIMEGAKKDKNLPGAPIS